MLEFKSQFILPSGDSLAKGFVKPLKVRASQLFVEIVAAQEQAIQIAFRLTQFQDGGKMTKTLQHVPTFHHVKTGCCGVQGLDIVL